MVLQLYLMLEEFQNNLNHFQTEMENRFWELRHRINQKDDKKLKKIFLENLNMKDSKHKMINPLSTACKSESEYSHV